MSLKDKLSELFNFFTSRRKDTAQSGAKVQAGLWDFRTFVDLMVTGFAYYEVAPDDAGDCAGCRYLYVNRAFEIIIGVKSGQLIGKTIHHATPGFEQGLGKLLARVAVTGEAATTEGFLSQQGRHYVAHAFSPRKGFCGVTLEDITERVQAEEKMRKAYTRLSSIAETSADILFRQDIEGAVTYVSPAVEQILGYSPEEVVGKKIYDLIPPDGHAKFKQMRAGVLSGTPLQSQELKARRKNGEIIDVEISSAPIFDSGCVVGCQGAMRDITDRKKAQEVTLQKSFELEVERLNWQTIFNSAQVGMILIDEDGFIRRANEVAARIVNKKPIDFLGVRFGEAFCCVHVITNKQACGLSPACLDCPLRAAYETVLHDGISLHPTEICREFVIDGKPRTVWIEIGAAQVSISDKAGVILSVIDITERKATLAALLQSEKRLGDIINAFPLPFYSKDIEERYRIFNQEFVDFIGVPAEKIKGATVYEVTSKELADIDFIKDRDLLAHPGSQVYEMPFQRSDGSLRDMVVFKRTLHDSEGHLQGLVGTILDITERKRTEERVKDSERRLQEFLNASPVPMFLKNIDGFYVYCNQAFADYYGLQMKDVIGKTIYQVVQRDFAEQLTEQDKKLFHDGQSLVTEVATVRPGGERRDMMIYKTVHYDARGRIIGIIGAFVDITERKVAEEEITRRGEELKIALAELQTAHDQLKKTQEQMLQAEKLAAIGLLAAGVAHEINNPLGFIGSNLSILEGYVRSLKNLDIAHQSLGEAVEKNDMALARLEHRKLSEQRKGLDIDSIIEDLGPLMKETREGFDRIARIVAELRTFSRIDHGQEEAVDVNAVLESVFRIVLNEIKYRIDLHKDFGPVPPIKGNGQQLGQVFMNILVNAAHAIKDHGKINVRTYSVEQEVVIEIEDNGEGIPREIMGRIFDPFFTTKAPGEGTGLGLSVSYDIVRRHGGSIGAESEVGKGTKFTVILPVEGAPGAE